MKEIIEGGKIKKNVNSNISTKVNDTNYSINIISAKEFITCERIDILIKYLYCKSIVEKENNTFLIELYLAHIKAFNGFVEADDTQKVGKECFLKNFNHLILSILKEGLKTETYIPIGSNAIPMDGAHRISIAAVLDMNIKAFNINEHASIFNCEFFKNRGMDNKLIDYASIEYAYQKTNVYMVMIWPVAKGHQQEIENILCKYGKIVNNKNIKLTYNGLLNLQRIEYKEENWLGNYTNDFEGLHTKCSQCYDKDGTLRTFLFESNTDLIQMKNEIRKLFNIGKHAVHINDTQDQTREIAQLIFNDNAIHFLNCNIRKETKSFNKLFNEFVNYLNENRINKKDVAIIGGILALYGVRDAKDLDYISITDKIPNKITNEIELETKKMKYTHYNERDIITDPRLHFVYNGIKFVNLKIILEIKKNRNNDSDKNDIRLIEKLLQDGKIKFTLSEKLRIWTSLSFYRRHLKLMLLKIRYILYLIKNRL